MKTVLIVFLFTVFFLVICLLLLEIKMLIKKDGDFKRHCASKEIKKFEK
jgi:hypothetical protein